MTILAQVSCISSVRKRKFNVFRTIELIFDDAKKYLESVPDGTFDVMVMDLADPLDDGPCFLLYTVKFYEFLRTKMSDNGVLVTQSGPAGLFTMTQVCTAIKNTLSKAFPSTQLMASHVPSFSDMYGYTLASVKPLPDLT